MSSGFASGLSRQNMRVTADPSQARIPRLPTEWSYCEFYAAALACAIPGIWLGGAYSSKPQKPMPVLSASLDLVNIDFSPDGAFAILV